MNKDLSTKVLEKIENKDVKPKSEWQFTAINSLWWLLAVLLAVVGGLAVAVMIYMVRFNDWDLYTEYCENFATFIVASLPYVWLVIFAGVVALVYFNVRNTRSGYKHPLWGVMLFVLAASIFLGIVFYFAGFGQKLHVVFGENIPQYNRIFDHKAQMWSMPDQGRLAGMVIYVEPDKINLLDLNRGQWIVLRPNEENQKIRTFSPVPGAKVRIIGVKVDDETFKAYQIMPWLPQQGPFERNHLPMRINQYKELQKVYN